MKKKKSQKKKTNQTHVLFLVLLNVVLVWVVLFSGIYDPGGGLLGKRNNSFWFPRPAPYEKKNKQRVIFPFKTLTKCFTWLTKLTMKYLSKQEWK